MLQLTNNLVPSQLPNMEFMNAQHTFHIVKQTILYFLDLDVCRDSLKQDQRRLAHQWDGRLQYKKNHEYAHAWININGPLAWCKLDDQSTDDDDDRSQGIAKHMEVHTSHVQLCTRLDLHARWLGFGNNCVNLPIFTRQQNCERKCNIISKSTSWFNLFRVLFKISTSTPILLEWSPAGSLVLASFDHEATVRALI